MALSPGTRLGPYEITGPLGAGGMGEVYRAHDSKLKRDVAIKILPEDVASDPERLNRFQREAEVLASLNHAHIAHVYGIEDRALVMELVEGEDLSQRISRGPMSVDEALPIAKQIVEALEAAHNASIVHRDLKPGNIKVRDDGTVKVLDFGLAKALDPVTATRDLANSPTITSPAMTQRGVILGTAAYMSPEQARGGAVDARTDIWAVGCVVYEMLTGKRAFDGSGSATEPDWQALPAGVPASIRTLLRRCIEKDPRKRAPHIAIARLAIEDAMTPVPEPLNRTARQSWLHGMEPIAITALFAAVLGLAVWVPSARFLSATAAPVPIHFLVEPPGTAAFVPRGVLFMSVAPHGRSMVFQADSPSGRHLWLHSFVDGTARPLPETDATTQFWSPDGRFVAFHGSGRLQKVDVTTGAVQTICDSRGAYGTWSKDGIILFGDRRIMRVASNGGTPEPITTLDDAVGDVQHAWPSFLPDGKRFLYTVVNRDASKSTLRLGDLGSSTAKIIATIHSPGQFIRSNHIVYAERGRLLSRPFDVTSARFTGEPIVVANSVRAVAGGQAAFSTSPTGVIAYENPASSRQSQDAELIWIARDGRVAAGAVPVSPAHVIALAPHDRAVVVDHGRESSIVDLERGTQTLLRPEKPGHGHPIWSPDGRRLVFYRVLPGSRLRLFIAPVNGSADEEPLLLADDPAATDQNPTDWSRDGRFIVYEESSRETGWDLKYVDLKGDRTPATAVATPHNDRLGQLSPDGRWLAYESDESGRVEIYVVSFPEGKQRSAISKSGGRMVRWSSHGRELSYINSTGILQSVSVSLSGGFRATATTALFPVNAPDNDGFTYAVSSDSTRFLVMQPKKGQQARIHVIMSWAPDAR